MQASGANAADSPDSQTTLVMGGSSDTAALPAGGEIPGPQCGVALVLEHDDGGGYDDALFRNIDAVKTHPLFKSYLHHLFTECDVDDDEYSFGQEDGDPLADMDDAKNWFATKVKIHITPYKGHIQKERTHNAAVPHPAQTTDDSQCEAPPDIAFLNRFRGPTESAAGDMHDTASDDGFGKGSSSDLTGETYNKFCVSFNAPIQCVLAKLLSSVFCAIGHGRFYDTC